MTTNGPDPGDHLASKSAPQASPDSRSPLHSPDSQFPDEAMAREEMVRVGRSLFERGYVHSTAGNISVRLADGFLITPTDACLGFLQPDRLARLDRTGHQLSGDRASKTLTLHRRIYDAAPRARSVIHSHSTHLVALSLAGVWRSNDILPPLTPYYVMKVGHVPMIPYRRPGDPAVAEEVHRTISEHWSRGIELRAVMLERLGPNVWHSSTAAAMATLEELEETARLWLLARSGGADIVPLPESAIEELRQNFGVTW